MKWKPIETAPKDGTEILGYREDAGVMLVRYIAPVDFLTEQEIEESGIDGESLEDPDWFCADFVCGSRLEEEERPTHWMPLPKGPDE